jgi:hypothetical protein
MWLFIYLFILFVYSFICLFFNLFFNLLCKDAAASTGGLMGEQLIISNSEAIGRDET